MNRAAVALGALGALVLLMVSRAASAAGYADDLWETPEPLWTEFDGELILETPQTRDVQILPATGGQWDVLPPTSRPTPTPTPTTEIPASVDESGAYTDDEGYTSYFDVAGNYVGYFDPYEGLFYPATPDMTEPSTPTPTPTTEIPASVDESGAYTDDEGYTYYFDVAGNYVGYFDPYKGLFYPETTDVTEPSTPTPTPTTTDSVGDWFTAQHFAALYPRALPGTYPPLVAVMDYYTINTPDRVAGFLAVIASESGGFRRMVESLAYLPERAFAIFGTRRITSVEDAAQLLAQGEYAFAERVYGAGSGVPLGNDQPGDGYKYIGHWWTQLTGKENHAKVGARLGIDLLSDPTVYLDVETAAWVSGDYWNSRSMNDPADERDIVEMTRRVAGSTRDDYVAYKQSWYTLAAPIVAQAATDYGIA